MADGDGFTARYDHHHQIKFRAVFVLEPCHGSGSYSPAPHRGGRVSIPGQYPTSEIYGGQTGTWTGFFFPRVRRLSSFIIIPPIPHMHLLLHFSLFENQGILWRKVLLLLVSSLKDVAGRIVELTATPQAGIQSSRLPSWEPCACKERIGTGSVGEWFGCGKEELTGGKSEKFVTRSFTIRNVHHMWSDKRGSNLLHLIEYSQNFRRETRRKIPLGD